MPKSTVAREMRLADDLAWVNLHLRHAATTLAQGIDRASGDKELTDEVEAANKILLALGKALEACNELAGDMPDPRMPAGTVLQEVRHPGCRECGEMAYEAAHSLLRGTSPRSRAYAGDMAHWADVTRTQTNQ